nr:MAG TPA: hypothetical protein [Caudoviricetes sp.]
MRGASCELRAKKGCAPKAPRGEAREGQGRAREGVHA